VSYHGGRSPWRISPASHRWRGQEQRLEDAADLPEPHVLAREIADDLRSALGQMEEILADLEERTEQVE